MKRVFIILGTFVLLIFTVQVFRLYYSGNTIPEYNYLSLDDKMHTNKELPKCPLIFVYFSPECGYCEKAILELSKLHKVNPLVNFVFVTNEKNKSVIKNFVMVNKMNELTSFIYIDMEDSFPMDFGLGMTYSTPTILVYNLEGKFVKEIKNYKDIASLRI